MDAHIVEDVLGLGLVPTGSGVAGGQSDGAIATGI